MKPGLGSSAGASRGLGVLGTSFFQHLPSPAPRPPGSGVVAPGDLREHLTSGDTATTSGTPPRTPQSRSRFLLLPLRLGSLRLCGSQQELGSRGFGCPLGTWSHSRWCLCVESPGFGSLPTFSRVAVPPPRLPQGPGVPGRGTILASAAARATAWGAGTNPGLWDHPIASSLAPGVSGQSFPLPKHPKPFISAWGGSWATPSPLPPRILGVPCHPQQSHSRGLGRGCQYYRAAASRGQGWGGSWCCPPSQKTRDCLWSVEPHRRVCTLQILQQNIF